MSENTLHFKNTTAALLLIAPLLILIVSLADLLDSAERRAARPAPQPPVTDLTELPPMIVLSEADGFTFETGSDSILPEFSIALDSLVPARVATLAATCRCDVVEIVGHTDGQRVVSRSTLDTALGKAVHDSAAALSPGSNADLGLMRAWAVARRLRTHPLLRDLTLLGLSAGSMILPDGSISAADDRAARRERRRIELRVRQSTQRVLEARPRIDASDSASAGDNRSPHR